MNLITDQRLAMRAHGYSPLPLNGKAPKLTSWPNLGDATDHQIEAWERARPAETNTGLLTRNNPAFDIDILSNADAAQAVADLIAEELRARGRIMVRFGRKPKRAVVCRTDAPFKKIKVEFDSSFTDPETGEIKHDAIEVLGDGQQLAALGEHPDTGDQYEWVGGSPVYVPASDLPLITEADALAVVDKAIALLAARFGINVRTPVKAARADTPVAEAKTTDTSTAWGAAALRSACDMIVNAGSGSQESTLNDQCYGIGQLVAGGELPEGEALDELLGAAEKIPDYDPKNPWGDAELAEKVKRAFMHGMSSPRAAPEVEKLPRLRLKFRKAGEAETEEEEMVEGESDAPPGAPRVSEAPDVARFYVLEVDLFNLIDQPGRIAARRAVDWTNVDGLLGEMRDWILNTSSRPNRRMAVMAAFAALSGATARHLYTPTGLGLGLVMAMLADTTVGKDAPLTAVGKILYAAGLGHMSQPAKSFTVSGFEQSIIDSHGACVATGDEIGENLLAKILSKKAMPYETMMKTFIMEATGQSDSSAPFALTKRSRQGLKGEEVIQTIPGFMFTLLGASTPDRFFESLSSGNVSDGLLGRNLIINADPKPKESKPPFVPVPDSVIAALKAITDIGMDKGKLIRWPAYDRIRIPWTPESEARYDLLGERIDAVLGTDPAYKELYGRVKANSLVLATLHAISRDHSSPLIEASDIDLGAAMVIESVKTTIAGLGGATGGTDYGRMVRDIEVYVRKKKTTTVREIGNAVRGYSKKERIAVLTDMEELGKVTIDRHKDSITPHSTVRWIARS